MIKRILTVFGANILGQLIAVVIQIVSIPMYLHFWGTDVYGTWLLLTAIPAYFMISGTGIGAVAGNSMQKHISLNEYDNALSIFQSAWFLTISLSVVLFISTITVVYFTPLFAGIVSTKVSLYEVNSTLTILALHILVMLQAELMSAVFRSIGKLARSTMILNIVRLIEFIGIMGFLYRGANIVSASSIYLVIRTLGTIWMILELKRNSWLKFNFSHVSRKIMRLSLLPTISFFGFPLGHAFLIQGMTMVVGIKFGAGAVVIFSTVRTLTGFIKQFSSTIYYSIWPELSTTLAQGKVEIARLLHRNAFQVTLLFSIMSCFILYTFGEWILLYWTRGAVTVDDSFLLLMLVASIPNTLWMMSSYVSISINNHTVIAFVYAVLAGVSTLVAYLFSPYFNLFAIPVATLICDTIILWFVLNCSFRIVNDRYKDFFSYIFFHLPFRQISKINS